MIITAFLHNAGNHLGNGNEITSETGAEFLFRFKVPTYRDIASYLRRLYIIENEQNNESVSNVKNSLSLIGALYSWASQ